MKFYPLFWTLKPLARSADFFLLWSEGSHLIMKSSTCFFRAIWNVNFFLWVKLSVWLKAFWTFFPIPHVVMTFQSFVSYVPCGRFHLRSLDIKSVDVICVVVDYISVGWCVCVCVLCTHNIIPFSRDYISVFLYKFFSYRRIIKSFNFSLF